MFPLKGVVTTSTKRKKTKTKTVFALIGKYTPIYFMVYDNNREASQSSGFVVWGCCQGIPTKILFYDLYFYPLVLFSTLKYFLAVVFTSEKNPLRTRPASVVDLVEVLVPDWTAHEN